MDTNDHLCPISGGFGSHLVLKMADGTVEVHLAPTKFVNEYQLILARAIAARRSRSKLADRARRRNGKKYVGGAGASLTQF